MIHELTLESYKGNQCYLVWDDQAGTLTGSGIAFAEIKKGFDNPQGSYSGAEAEFTVEDPAHKKDDFMALLAVVAGGMKIVSISDGLAAVAPGIKEGTPADIQDQDDSGMFGQVIH